MSQKQFIQIACRAVSLNLLMTSLLWLALVPVRMHAVLHYRSIFPRTPSQDFAYTNDFILLMSYIGISAGVFLAAVWIYRCGPKVETFLSPSEE